MKKTFQQLETCDDVRIKRYPEGDMNSHGRVTEPASGDLIHVANLNMPYAGTISHFFKEEELDWKAEVTENHNYEVEAHIYLEGLNEIAARLTNISIASLTTIERQIARRLVELNIIKMDELKDKKIYVKTD